MERERLAYLYQQYLQNKASSEELDEWQKILHDASLKEALGNIIDNSYYQILEKDTQDLDGNRSEEIYNHIIKHAVDERSGPKKLWPKILIAAAVVTMIASAGIWFFNSKNETATDRIVRINDITPGKHSATITLTNGKVIELSDTKTGVVVGTELKYTDGTTVKGGNAGLQRKDVIATTARGQTYLFTLPDGSKVWLNADSKLEFSSDFVNSKTRNVKLIGEGYFEVAKDKAHPFIVQSAGQEVEVLGTEFNIDAYPDDEFIKTTLAEGSIRLKASGKNVVLKPNQLAVSGNGTINVKDVDAELAMAWKTGFFLFDRESLASIMIKIARWYDVDIVFNDPLLKKETFTGTVSRFDNISQVFKVLEQSEVARFKIEGRKITVGRRE